MSTGELLIGEDWRDAGDLVQHPQGDLLIDAGFGSDVAAYVAKLLRIVRAPLRRPRP